MQTSNIQLTVVQTTDDGFTKLQYTDMLTGKHYYYQSAKSVSWTFRDFNDVSTIGAIDFYNITAEERTQVERSLKWHMIYMP